MQQAPRLAAAGLLLLLATPQPAVATVIDWHGTFNNAWGNAGCWTPGQIPVMGDDVIYYLASTGNTTWAGLNNSDTGNTERQATSITFNSNITSAFEIRPEGDRTTLTADHFLGIGGGGITVDSAADITLYVDVNLRANQIWTVNGTTTLVANSQIRQDVAGRTLTKAGTGTLTLGNASTGSPVANTYTGLTTVAAGTLDLNKTAGNNAIPGDLTITGGSVVLLAANQIADTCAVNLASPGSLNLNGNAETVGSLAGSGTLTNGGAAATLTTGGNGATTDFSGAITGALALTKAGAGAMTLSGAADNTYTGLTTVSAGTLNLNKDPGSNAIGGNLTITGGSAVLLASNQIGDTGIVRLNNSDTGTTFDLNGFSETVAQFRVNPAPTSGAELTYTHSPDDSLTLTGNMQLGGGADSTTTTRRGNVTQNGGSVSIGGDLVFGGAAATEGGAYQLNGGTLGIAGSIVETDSTVDSAQFYLDVDTDANPSALSIGGSITVQSFRLGQDAGHTGTYTLTGGKGITNTGTFIVGYQGDGTLTVNDTGSVITVTNRLQIADRDTSSGTLTLTAGTIDVNGGGMFLAGDGNNADPSAYPDTTADMVMGTPGGNLTDARLFTNGTSGDNLEVARGGTASFTQHSGTVTVEANDLVIGQAAGSDGTYTMDGGKLVISVGALIIGSQGTGELTVTDPGALITVANRLQVANADTSTGTLTLTAGTIDVNGGGMFLAGDGTNTDAGAYPGTTADVALGTPGGNLTDARLFTRGANLEVARGGTATFTQHSGTVTVETNNLILGQAAGSDGTYTMNGGKLETLATGTSGYLRVGNTGTGHFIQNGGNVSCSGTLDLGNGSAAGDGRYDFLGGTLTIGGTFVVGNLRTGVFNFEDGTLNFGAGHTLYIGGTTTTGAGDAPNANGTFTLGTSTTAPVLSTGQFEVGRHATGIMNHVNGTVYVNGANNLVISQYAGGNATYNMMGGLLSLGSGANGSINFNSGTGVFNQTGGTVEFHGGSINLTNAATGNATYNLKGGLLDLGGGNINPGLGTEAFHFTGGTLRNVGTIALDLIQTDADGFSILAPGASPGTTTITGIYNLLGGGLQIEIQDPDLAGAPGPAFQPGIDHDLLNVTGTAFLDGILMVELLGGLSLDPGQTFGVLTAPSIVLGSHFAVGGPDGDSFYSYILGDSPAGQTLVIEATLQRIPEPATLTLLALGGLGLLRRRRRKP
ncbi:MAG TPA: autotransporter-associated beta strand repeat-containing protein [Planctomycetota bacterium]|nr:autotransporter-associated beta strand repeat-containing protein [Planctomycetota bacterium]